MKAQELTPFVPGTDLQSRASEQGLVIPQIEIVDKLQLRLARRDKTLKIDEDALWRGVQNIELENSLKVQINSLPKNPESTDPLISYQSDTEFLLRVGYGANAKKGIDKRVNTALWLGMLVTDELAEGNKEKYEEKGLFGRSKGIKINTGGVIGSLTAIALETGGVYDLPDLPHSLAAASYLAYVVGYFIRNNSGESSNLKLIVKKIANEKRKQAEELGKKHHVLNYTDTVSVA